MMVYKKSESARDNFSKFIEQLQPKTKRLVRKLKRILIKFNRQNVSLLFNQTFLNEGLQPPLPTHIYMCVCMSVCLF